MGIAWMFAVMLSGPPVADRSPQPVVAVRQTGTTQSGIVTGSTSAELKTADPLSRAAEHRHPDYARVVPRLTQLVRELKRQRAVAPTRIDTMRRRLSIRLAQIQRILLRRLRREQSGRRGKSFRTARYAPRRRQRVSPPNDMKLAGPGDIAGARALIDLIQAAIAPDSWAINGGQGRISDYRPLHVLVIRQTGEVHHQIGGTLRQLGR